MTDTFKKIMFLNMCFIFLQLSVLIVSLLEVFFLSFVKTISFVFASFDILYKDLHDELKV